LQATWWQLVAVPVCPHCHPKHQHTCVDEHTVAHTDAHRRTNGRPVGRSLTAAAGDVDVLLVALVLAAAALAIAAPSAAGSSFLLSRRSESCARSRRSRAIFDARLPRFERSTSLLVRMHVRQQRDCTHTHVHLRARVP
jgi:hypothetical protein